MIDTTSPPIRRFDAGVWLAAGWLTVVVAAATFADALPLANPSDTTAGPPLSRPNASNLLGTDQLGRDLLARAVYGSRVSITVAVVAVVAVVLVGGGAGLVAGYSRHRPVAHILMWGADVLLAMPATLLAIVVVTFSQSRSTVVVAVAVALVYLAPTMRITRTLAAAVSTNEYVLVADALGARRRRIIIREVLPNVAPAVASFAPLALGGAIVAEGGLAYLNLSVAPPTPTWGAMIAAGVTRLDDSAYPALVPAAALFLTVLALTVVGDRLDRRPHFHQA